MTTEEEYVKLVSELIDGIDAGEFSGSLQGIYKYNFKHLEALFVMLPYLEGGDQLYRQLYDIVIKCAMDNIKRKTLQNEKICIRFLVISAAEWSADALYWKLKNDDRVDCKIIVSPLIDRDKDGMLDSYIQTYSFFSENNYDVVGGYNVEEDYIYKFAEITEQPDMVIHLSPWYTSMPETYRITSYPFDVLNCYIPYCMSTGDSVDGMSQKNFNYNKEFMNFQWRVYTDSSKNLQGFKDNGLLRAKNVRYSGYLKMDRFLNRKEYNKEEIKKLWKIPEGVDVSEVKKVIIAPHHSFLGYAGIAFSTFKSNAHFLFYLAEKYEKRVSFILKPHPSMRVRAVEAGVFADYAEYDEYIRKWNALPNAKVVREADYLDLFETSDGMIMDSISFLAEYLYVNKPLLFLRRKGQAFNELGKCIIESHYSANGEDYKGIEDFLKNIVINQNDYMQEKRTAVFEDELNYSKDNGCSACEYIYRDICETLFGYS